MQVSPPPENENDGLGFTCAGCGGQTFTAGPDNVPLCVYCYRPYFPPAPICPACGLPCRISDYQCPRCGAEISRPCPHCGALNPPETTTCLVCRQEVGVLGPLFERVVRRRGDWLDETRTEAERIKAQEEAASQARMAQMWEIEERRLEALARARAERERQHRILWAITAVIFLIIVVFIIAMTVLTAHSGPCPI